MKPMESVMRKTTSAERKLTHNTVEKARRESLNSRFMELAANMPATCGVRRPSKLFIVKKSLEFVTQALDAESAHNLKVKQIMKEKNSIEEELNQYRRESGLASRTPSVEPGFNWPGEFDFDRHSHRSTSNRDGNSVSPGSDSLMDFYCQGARSSSSSLYSLPNALPIASESSLEAQDDARMQDDTEPLQNSATLFQDLQSLQKELAKFPIASDSIFNQHPGKLQEPTYDTGITMTPDSAAILAQMLQSEMSNTVNSVTAYHDVKRHGTNTHMDQSNQSYFANMAAQGLFH